MNTEHIRRIRLVYGMVLSAVAILAGICLMAACLGIYRSGGQQTYTPEKVAAAFAPIALPVYGALVLALGGFILDFALPASPKKPKPEKNRGLTLSRLRRAENIPADALAAADGCQRRRRLHAIISAALLAAGAAVFLIYALNGTHFDSRDITGSVVRAMWWLTPCMGVPFGYSVFAAYYSRRSMDREIDLLKEAGAKAPKQPLPAAAPCKWALYGRLAVLALAIGLMAYGFLAGGWADVLTKAVNICTECVGLG